MKLSERLLERLYQSGITREKSVPILSPFLDEMDNLEAENEAQQATIYEWMNIADHARNDLLSENDRMTWAKWFCDKIDVLLKEAD